MYQMVLVSILFFGKRQGTSYTGKYLIGVCFQFQRLVHCSHASKHGARQDNMVPGKLKVLYPDPKAARREGMRKSLGHV